jgi:hypothetical protein
MHRVLQIIIGIRDIMGPYFEVFVATLLRSEKRNATPKNSGVIPGTNQLVVTIHQIHNELD